MKCPDTGILQAYIDGELEIEQKKAVENHISMCTECSDAYNELKNNDDFAFAKMKNYRQYFEDNLIPRSVPARAEKQKKSKPFSTKGVFDFMTKYKKLAAAACVVIAVTTCITVQPVRSAIAGTLSIFRVENVKGINISLQDLQDIQKKIEMKEAEINMDDLGKVKLDGGKRRSASVEEVKSIPDFTVALPSSLADIKPNVDIIEPATVSFALAVENFNSVLKSFGATRLLPESVDGKTFSANFSSRVFMNYKMNDRQITVTQLKAPEIIVPDGVDVDEIYSSLVELPILPKDLQTQLKSIKDWKNTLYIPVVEAEMEEVAINGAKGYVSSDTNRENNTVRSRVIWYNKGIIYTINGNISKDEILTIAQSMR